MRTITLSIILCALCATVNAQAPISPAVTTIAYEASGEPLDVQMRVACVIRNRARERNQTEEQVVYASKQFSCWQSPGVIAPGMAKRTKTELATAQKAYEMSKGIQFKANLYHDISIKCPWKGVEYLGQWGRIKFYYEKR